MPIFRSLASWPASSGPRLTWRGSLAERSGEVYVLEMGDSIKIIELAETMIRLSGLEPERDIAIEIVGARPGEKFHEDLFNPYERPPPTPVQRILRAQRQPLDPQWTAQTFADLNLLVLEGDAAALAEMGNCLPLRRGFSPACPPA